MKDFNDIEQGNPYRHLLWKRGFYASCSGKQIRIHPHWETYSFNTLNITYDPEQPFDACKNDDMFLVILGHFVSLNYDDTDHKQLTSFLFDALVKSVDDFLDELDACCGRFVCFYSTRDGIHVLNDATGMKMVYYSTTINPAVASHSFILKSSLEKAESAECKKFFT